MAAPNANRVETSPAAPVASFCRRKDHGLCQAAQARCGCSCHGPGGQHPPVVRLTAVKPAPRTLAQRLDAFEARLPGHLLEEWQALRRELTAVAAPAWQPTTVRPQDKAKVARKNPTPTTRICSACKTVKPLDVFNVKNPKTGALRAQCQECQRDGWRKGRLKVGQVAIDVELLEGDAMVGQLCPTCALPFFIGETVVAGHVCHKGCESDGEVDQ